MKNQRKADQVATERAEMLGPLLTPGLDPAKRSQIIREICNKWGSLSEAYADICRLTRLKDLPD